MYLSEDQTCCLVQDLKHILKSFFLSKIAEYFLAAAVFGIRAK